MLQEIKSWQTCQQLINTPERLTTRGLNKYKEHDRRGEYVLTHDADAELTRRDWRKSSAFSNLRFR